MKKQLLSIAILGFAFCAYQHTFAQSTNPQNINPPAGGYNRCGSMEHLEWQKQHDPGLQARMDKVESDMRTWLKNPPPIPNAITTIPVVIHVVYANAAQNVSDAVCKQQIDRLNLDYHKLNTDVGQTPAAFQSLVADAEVQFCLAVKDPSGNATTGIIHKSTTVASWSTDDLVKSSSSGGDDAWDATKYLNLWVCNLGGGLLGYAQFPGGAASTDGVVVLYSSLPGGAAPYGMGRSATHEVGHWLNLRHIWGDANCGDDLVSDTPTAQTSNFGCPTFPHVTCSNGPNGDMFMNYMDYVDDNCMVMFSAGQKARMQSCLFSSRTGLGPASSTKCGATSVNELLPADNLSLYPNPSAGDIFMSINIPNISSADVTVYNAIGDAVLQKRVLIPSSNEVKLDMNSHPNGMYFIKMKTADGIITKKVVINR